MKTAMRNERRIYFFDCEKCGNRRSSFKKSRAKKGICRKCRRNKPVDGQMEFKFAGNPEIVSIKTFNEPVIINYDVPFYELELPESE